LKELPLGAIVATGYLFACRLVVRGQTHYTIDDPHLHASETLRKEGLWLPPPEPELSFGDYTPGRYAWILTNVKALPEPIPAKGALGLWEWNLSNQYEAGEDANSWGTFFNSLLPPE
jgi:hypothetical protein